MPPHTWTSHSNHTKTVPTAELTSPCPYTLVYYRSTLPRLTILHVWTVPDETPTRWKQHSMYWHGHRQQRIPIGVRREPHYYRRLDVTWCRSGRTRSWCGWRHTLSVHPNHIVLGLCGHIAIDDLRADLRVLPFLRIAWMVTRRWNIALWTRVWHMHGAVGLCLGLQGWTSVEAMWDITFPPFPAQVWEDWRRERKRIIMCGSFQSIFLNASVLTENLPAFRLTHTVQHYHSDESDVGS